MKNLNRSVLFSIILKNFVFGLCAWLNRPQYVVVGICMNFRLRPEFRQSARVVFHAHILQVVGG